MTTPLDMESYGDGTSDNGESFNVQIAEFSALGEVGAFASLLQGAWARPRRSARQAIPRGS